MWAGQLGRETCPRQYTWWVPGQGGDAEWSAWLLWALLIPRGVLALASTATLAGDLLDDGHASIRSPSPGAAASLMCCYESADFKTQPLSTKNKVILKVTK